MLYTVSSPYGLSRKFSNVQTSIFINLYTSSQNKIICFSAETLQTNNLNNSLIPFHLIKEIPRNIYAQALHYHDFHFFNHRTGRFYFNSKL